MVDTLTQHYDMKECALTYTKYLIIYKSLAIMKSQDSNVWESVSKYKRLSDRCKYEHTLNMIRQTMAC
jgi:hypothetical protein